MDVPEYIKKEIQRAIDYENSPEVNKNREDAIKYLSMNKIEISNLVKIANENSKYFTNNINDQINSIKYIQEYIPDLNIIKNAFGVIAQSMIQSITFPLRNAESVVAVNELAENISIKDSIDFFDYLTNYPMLGYMHDVGKKIFDFIKKQEKCALHDIHLFRIRAYSQKRKNPYSILELIGPPFGISTQNRFSNIGAKVSYFSDSAEVLKMEININKDDKYSQIEIKLKKQCLMLDIRNLDIPVFKMCHNKIERANDYFNIEYVLPNYLSDCARKSGFDGIIYRSTIDYNATNYAFFYLTENDIEKIDRYDNLPD